MGGEVIFNDKIYGYGSIPKWGIKYLEPDITLKLENTTVFADVKYKANLYNFYDKSDILHETHRTDLHQILSYCSFAESTHKVGILVYPSDEICKHKLNYNNHSNGVNNDVYMIGIPFTMNSKNESVNFLQELLVQICNEQPEEMF